MTTLNKIFISLGYFEIVSMKALSGPETAVVGPYLFWPLEAHGICPIRADNLGSSIPAVELKINPLKRNPKRRKNKGARREIGKSQISVSGTIHRVTF